MVTDIHQKGEPKMDEIMESLTRLQKLCQDLNAETSRLMEACRFGEIQNN